ncbi:MlaE family ABC transporter permease [Paracoccus sanguinis]|uniref:Phospholipid/cholesterol/gamma-HCH transport system permease protein n=1 Tax=Paracoccus sanguinis TaxID=1545044 RepID=A0A099G426_9RHOB|nr:ABC transporter permease [Paracoccus sanguinis]KGJ17495.1 ABC transporter permease [Paracoccus sanguinis]KGJ18063.1 ABC transporter permease [Paracoccus sanguinis]SDX53027.1 phospholipid/cholesterol/gamma-HCH transport system permease protein [Paracoccus sanguinis]
MNPLAALGRVTLRVVRGVGQVAIFAARGLAAPGFHPALLARQLLRIGWLSLPVVGLTALFTGAALALQINSGGERFQAGDVVPAIVAIGMVRELGPVLGGLMVAARVASSIAAEIGSMRVSEQIDALVTLSTDPMGWLVTPRLWAAILSVPVLVAVGDAIGIMGGWLVGTTALGFTSQAYISNSWAYLESWDVLSGLIKGAVFGAIVALAGCWFGMHAGRGAEGVGRATTNAVVAASVGILAANFVLTGLFFT